jgi:hypothetical protein
MNTFTAARPSGGILALPRRAEAWLDARGRAAWIVSMILGFVFFWPVGLGLLAYITYTNRWSTAMFGSHCRKSRATHWGGVYSPSGNSAFDAYKSETLRRLEDEQQAFNAFLQRLREAKDKSEFDTFMEDRARTNKAEPADAAPRGEY